MREGENAIETSALGKRYGSFWALLDCDITVPSGRVSALVGPNGAGKTTLLKLLAGLNRPSAGRLTALGRKPDQTGDYLTGLGYLAQEIPLYQDFTASDHLAIGSHLDARWDHALAIKRLTELKVPLDRPVGKLSRGQRAQVGLAMVLAKRPKLLLLDEPVAALDPLARADFLTTLTRAVADAEGELTVVMSSHLLSDLERVCDHIILLAAGETQLCADIDHVLETHRLFVGPRGELATNSDYVVVQEMSSDTATYVLVRLNRPDVTLPGWHGRDVDIERIVLGYMEQSRNETTSEGSMR